VDSLIFWFALRKDEGFAFAGPVLATTVLGVVSWLILAVGDYGIYHPVGTWTQGLPEAAERTGGYGDRLISRAELAIYTIESTLNTDLLKPIEVGVEIQRILGEATRLLLIALPWPVLRCLRRWRRPATANASSSTNISYADA